MDSTRTSGNIISFILVAQPLLMQPQWLPCGEEVIYSSYCAKRVQSDSLVQYLPLPLTRKSWANSVNFCCLIYKTIKTAHPSPFPTIMPCLTLCISAWGLLRPLVHCLPWTGGVNVKPSPPLSFFSGFSLEACWSPLPISGAQMPWWVGSVLEPWRGTARTPKHPR